ncbi:murein hydrolase activator EnvC [Erysipelothrix urinaevulpis]|uniref:murein hydrolase activator EnvC family protein n=1 Tax=Erysipelothrix urinaevulpis TaxID=2683717 RepID=UPI0013577179|nr:peptidoglycan DD-metalloendopeptidase family protein [Erysipelothrix urinaevulpis]
MKRKTKQIIILVVVILMGLGLFSPLFALSDKDYNYYSANESKYDSLCYGGYNPSNKGTCEQYKQYKQEKRERLKKEIESASKTQGEIQGQLDDEQKKLETYHSDIKRLENEIVENEKKISAIEASIKKTEKEIKEREDHIEELNKLVKKFLVNMQGEMRVNGYIEFLMGASDFSDIVRRSEGMKRIKEYNEAIIAEILEEQKKLEADKEKLEENKKDLELEKELAVAQVEKTKALKAKIEAIVKELLIQKANQVKLQETKTKLSDSEKNNMDKIFQQTPPPVDGGGGGGGSSSSGWGSPIGGSYGWGPGVWNYPASFGGHKHMGQDFSVSIGTPLLAVGNGVAVGSSGGCPTWGGYPNSCNGGWGNWVNLVVNINGKYYGLLYAHLQAGGVHVGAGQAVSKGQRIGLSGSSGASTGPHLHLEVYYLGTNSAQALSYYTTNTFGTGSSSYGNEYSKRCNINGNTPPCRMNPASVVG